MIDFEDNELFVDAPVAYSVLGASGELLAANRKFWALFRCKPGTDLAVADITHDDFQDTTVDYLKELRDGVRDSIVVDKRYVRPDGTSFWGRLTANRFAPQDGAQLLLGVIEDIDEQYELEAKLRVMATEQTEFVARVSHELRNPLHTIAGLAELLESADIDAHSQRQAGIIMREAQGLTSIVSDLLDIGRFESGNLALEFAPFAVRALIDRSVRTTQGAAKAKGLAVQTYVDDALPIYAVGDAGRLGQVIDNLCGNAVKFTTEGSITVDVRLGPDEVVMFRVIDTGPGIPDQRQREVFEPFQRLNASAPGAGLGLAISGRLATSMGGQLKLESSSPEGSTFCLSVPLPATDAPIEAGGSAHRASGGDHKAARVLVVEDNVETQMLAKAQLTRLGYDHDVVGDGYQALELTERVAFDAILMDWHLPGIDGLETTRRIRQREAREGRERTPIISVTARAMAADVEACMQAGADDFIAKPASITAVGEALERWTGATVEETGPGAGAVDTDVFTTLLDELGDYALVLSIARTFLDELPRRVEAIAEGDAESTELAAHTLKSTSAMLGAHTLRDMAEELERSAREGNAPTAEHVEQLRNAAKDTEDAVQELITKLESAT